MDPNGMFDLMESSGSLPDDEDLDDYYDVDSDSDEGSASGGKTCLSVIEPLKTLCLNDALRCVMGLYIANV